MEWLQKFYIIILTPFSKLSNRISLKTRKRGIYVICFLLYATCYCWYSVIGQGIQLTLLSRMLESIFLIMLLIFLGLDTSLKPIKWNRIIGYLWFVLGMLIFVMGFFHEQNTGYWMTGPVIAVGLPCLFMVYGSKNKYEMLFDAICKSAIIIAIIYFIIALFGEFFSNNVWDFNDRYNALTIDANKIGELCLSSFACIMYYLLVGKSRIWKILSLVALGGIIGQIYWTQSRTTILAALLIFAFAFVIVLKGRPYKKGMKKLLLNSVGLFIVVIIALGSIAVINTFHKNGITYEKWQAIIEANEGDANTERATKAQQVAEKNEYRSLLPTEDQDVNNFSAGRIFIWKTYAEKFNITGNPADAEHPISPLIAQRTAHNSLIEITYRSGYITGIVYLILEIISGVYILMVMFRNNRKNTNGDYFFAIMAIGYIIFTNLMSSFNPLTAIIFLTYTIAFPVLLEQKSKIE